MYAFDNISVFANYAIAKELFEDYGRNETMTFHSSSL